MKLCGEMLQRPWAHEFSHYSRKMNQTMLKRRRIILFSMFLAGGLVLLPALSHAENFEQGAKRFVRSMADEALQSLTIIATPRPKRVVKFRKLLHEYFDYRTIAAWVLGRHWRRATKDQKKEYFNLFEDLLIETYVDRFARYPGSKLEITKAITSGGRDIVVSSVLDQADGQPPAKVDWRVRAREGKFKIIDVIVEGLSMGQTQRSEFSSVIRQNGGTVDGLLVELRKKIKNLKNTQLSKES